MKLSFGLGFRDLYERAGLLRVDAAFLSFLEPSMQKRLLEARSKVIQLGSIAHPVGIACGQIIRVLISYRKGRE